MEEVGKKQSLVCRERKGPFLGFRTERSPWVGEVTIPREGFPAGSDGEESACSAGDPGSIPGLGRSPGEGNGNPLQYSCQENPVDGGARRLEPTDRKESDTPERLTPTLQGVLRAPFRGQSPRSRLPDLGLDMEGSKGFQGA